MAIKEKNTSHDFQVVEKETNEPRTLVQKIIKIQ